MTNLEFFTEIELKNISYVADAIKAHLASYKEAEELSAMYMISEYFSSRSEDLYCAFQERHEECKYLQEVNAFKEAFVRFLESYKESRNRIQEIEFRERNPEF